MRTKITLLGATGSIGSSTLDVIAANPDKYELYAAVCGGNDEKMLDIIKRFAPKRAAVYDKDAARRLKDACALNNLSCDILEGSDGVLEIAADKEGSYVVAAIVGAMGLPPVLAAVKRGAVIGLANKEALVMSGKLFFNEVKKYGAKVLPIDSEHSAIFQCLPQKAQESLGSCDLKDCGVDKILLTGSGGPFRTIEIEKLQDVTPSMAINHPVWSMGPKISVDSSTMMNKGLEFIEARYLFNACDDDVKVVIHPQSVVHSMVSYIDGAVLAQLGNPDMKTPIARALAYPQRVVSGVNGLDFCSLKALTFEEPDFKRYPCLALAMQASKLGQGATTALNAANEVAVDAFLNGACRYLDIASLCAQSLDVFGGESPYSLEEIFDLDARVRDYIKTAVTRL